MIITALNQDEKTIVKECLNAVINGPFIPDWEFQTLLGLTRSELTAIFEHWPQVLEQRALVGIRNALGNLIGYPIDNEEKWPEYISVSKEKVSEIFEKIS